MTKLYFCGSAILVLAGCVAVSCSAYAQVYPNQEVRIDDLPLLTANSTNASAVLATSAEIIFRDKEVCCGKSSALGDSIQAADPMSLKDISDKLRGRHLLSDGRPIMVTSEYWPAVPGNPNSSNPISEIMEKRALLIKWNSHLYVVYGVIYDKILDDNGTPAETIRKFLLLDPRFSDERRKVFFNRQTDDWGKVEGLLMLKAVPQ